MKLDIVIIWLKSKELSLYPISTVSLIYSIKYEEYNHSPNDLKQV